MLEFKNLSKRYGDLQALGDVSFSVQPGRAVGFLGANGAGKTTTMRTVFGLVRPDSGITLWNGQAIDDNVRLRFGYMPEQRGLYGGMKVREQLIYLTRLHGLNKAEASTGTDLWLEKLGLSERANDPLEKLSHGNQQRVQLAAALVHQPDLLVLDEPFSGLDPIGVDNMKNILIEETRRGAAVLFSSHQLDLVEDICDDIAIINDGGIALSGDLSEIRASSQVRNVIVVGPQDGSWTQDVPGVHSHDYNEVNNTHSFLVNESLTATDFLAIARSAGPIEAYTYTPPTLEDIYRETVR